MNRLCTQIAEKYGWGFANINLRSYYAEGAKTYGFEIAEQLGWKFPRHVVSPVAGGTLLPRIARAFRELKEVGLVERRSAGDSCRAGGRLRAGDQGARRGPRISGSRSSRTRIAKSIAIGNPADGFQVIHAVQVQRRIGRDGHRQRDSRRRAADRGDRRASSRSRPAAPRMACTLKLIQNGSIPRDESIVVCITGNGYKTAEVMTSRVKAPVQLGRALKEFDDFMEQAGKAPSCKVEASGRSLEQLTRMSLGFDSRSEVRRQLCGHRREDPRDCRPDQDHPGNHAASRGGGVGDGEDHRPARRARPAGVEQPARPRLRSAARLRRAGGGGHAGPGAAGQGRAGHRAHRRAVQHPHGRVVQPRAHPVHRHRPHRGGARTRAASSSSPASRA